MLALALGGLIVVGTFQMERRNPFWVVLTFVAFALCVWLLSFVIELAVRCLPRLAVYVGPGSRAARLFRAHAPTLVLLLVLGHYLRNAREDYEALGERSTLLREGGVKSDELYAWMRDKTPRDAVFLTPPEVDEFRFYGQRAIVVDWKATPMVPSEFVEWLNRLSDVSGRPVKHRRDLSGYGDMDRDRLLELKAKYHLVYAIVRRGAERELGYEPVFRNHRYAVLRL
jgi:hypothetical protein